jgi:hypothetical protein
MVVVWCLWNPHNRIIFQEGAANPISLVAQIKLVTWGWFIGRAGRKTGYTYSLIGPIVP